MACTTHRSRWNGDISWLTYGGTTHTCQGNRRGRRKRDMSLISIGVWGRTPRTRIRPCVIKGTNPGGIQPFWTGPPCRRRGKPRGARDTVYWKQSRIASRVVVIRNMAPATLRMQPPVRGKRGASLTWGWCHLQRIGGGKGSGHGKHGPILPPVFLAGHDEPETPERENKTDTPPHEHNSHTNLKERASHTDLRLHRTRRTHRTHMSLNFHPLKLSQPDKSAGSHDV